MKLKLALGLTLGLLVGTRAMAQQTSPYVETVPVTLEWVLNTNKLQDGTPGGKIVPFKEITEDPKQLNPVGAVKTDVIKPGIYTETDKRFLIKWLVTELSARRSKLKQPAIPSPTSGTWELTAVREPQSSIEGALETPYTLFLTRIDKQAGGTQTYSLADIVTLNLTGGSGAFAESRTQDDTLVKATGTASCGVELVMNFRSKYVQKTVNGEYMGEGRTLVAAGTLTQSLKNTSGGAVYPVSGMFTSIGSWEEFEIESNGDTTVFAGNGPVKMKLGTAKFQSRSLFPEFTSATL